jgi:hypothetical protein
MDHINMLKASWPTRKRALIMALTVLGTLWPGPSPATTVSRFSLEDLANNAACIFVGICEHIQVESTDGQIYTRYRFAVSQIIKGENPEHSSLEFSLPGGEIEGQMQHVVGMPNFEPGVETILFLTSHNSLGHAWPVGLGQGAFEVRREQLNRNLPAMVYRRFSGLNLLNREASATSSPAKGMMETAIAIDGGIPLNEFLARLGSILTPDAVDESLDDSGTESESQRQTQIDSTR